MGPKTERRCNCGSGKPRYPLHDVAGIFLTYVCETCEPEKKKGYNPAIFRSGSKYAQSGEEEDLW